MSCLLYVLRRVGNVPLKNVAARANISPARISQIQARIEQGGGVTTTFPGAKRLRAKYKLKC